jgi:hypothetical protein
VWQTKREDRERKKEKRERRQRKKREREKAEKEKREREGRERDFITVNLKTVFSVPDISVRMQVCVQFCYFC